MAYRKPEVAVLGDAVIVIQGRKGPSVEPDGVTVPGLLWCLSEKPPLIEFINKPPLAAAGQNRIGGRNGF